MKFYLITGGECIMKVRCPKCGSENVCEILYGMPTSEALELEEQGKIIFGGCEIIMDDLPQPDYGCLDCKFQWAPELPDATDIIKIRFKIWTSAEKNDDKQKYTVYEMFPNGMIRIYQYMGKSKKIVAKIQKNIEANKIIKLAVALQKQLNVLYPYMEKISEKIDEKFDLQISYCDGRKITIRTGDVGADEFYKLVRNVLSKYNIV